MNSPNSDRPTERSPPLDPLDDDEVTLRILQHLGGDRTARDVALESGRWSEEQVRASLERLVAKGRVSPIDYVNLRTYVPSRDV